MKITADCIDHNVMELIDLLLLWETQNFPNEQTICCGYIQGMIDLAKRLKEVLKV